MADSLMRKRRRGSGDSSDTGSSSKRSTRNITSRDPQMSPQSSVQVDRIDSSGRSNVFSGNVNIGNLTVNGDSSRTTTAPQTRRGMPTRLSDDEKGTLTNLLEFPQMDARLMNVTKAQQRTCKWLLDHAHYQLWKTENCAMDHRFLYIKGNPGSGKSTAMRFLHQKLSDEIRSHKTQQSEGRKGDVLIAFFFNARGGDLEKSTQGLYQSLLHSIFNNDPALQRAYDAPPRRVYSGIMQRKRWESNDQELLKEVLEEAVRLLIAEGRNLYIVVDALDESVSKAEDVDENVMRDVIDMITYFERFPTSEVSEGGEGHGSEEGCSRVHICVSSRCYPQIPVETNLEITLDNEAGHMDDIANYIGDRLWRLKNDDKNEEDFRNRVKKEMMDTSRGNFLWVNLVVGQLNEFHREGGTNAEVLKRLKDMPKKAKEQRGLNGAMPLYELFRDIITKDKKEIPTFLRFVQLVHYSKAPRQVDFRGWSHGDTLRPQGFLVALHQTYEVPFDDHQTTEGVMEKKIRHASKGLAAVVSNSESKWGRETIQFIHETVEDFIRDGELQSLAQEFGYSIDDGHEMLKTSCLQQVQQFPWNSLSNKHLQIVTQYRQRSSGHYCDREHQLSVDDKTAFLHQAEKSYPFLKYAVGNVMFHANESEASGNAQTTFLETFPLDSWVPLHNILGHRHPFAGAQTPILFILAFFGFHHLLQESNVRLTDYCRIVVGERSDSALACALVNNRLDTARHMVGLAPTERSRNVSIADAYREPLLGSLIHPDDVRLLEKVLKDGFCHHIPDSEDLRGHSPLSWAIYSHPIRMAEVFPRDSREEVDFNEYLDPTLCFAAKRGHTGLFKLLLESGKVYADCEDTEGQTPLSIAAFEGHTEIVKLLLESGKVSVDDEDEDGVTPLGWAVIGSHAEIVKLLLETDQVDANHKTCDGETALLKAAYDGSIEVVKILLKSGKVDVNCRDRKGLTAVFRASSKHDVETLRWLSESGVYVDCKDDRGQTPFSKAIETRLSDVPDRTGGTVGKLP